MLQYLIGFPQSINDSAVSFWPDSTDTNAGIFRVRLKSFEFISALICLCVTMLVFFVMLEKQSIGYHKGGIDRLPKGSGSYDIRNSNTGLCR